MSKFKCISVAARLLQEHIFYKVQEYRPYKYFHSHQLEPPKMQAWRCSLPLNTALSLVHAVLHKLQLSRGKT